MFLDDEFDYNNDDRDGDENEDRKPKAKHHSTSNYHDEITTMHIQYEAKLPIRENETNHESDSNDDISIECYANFGEELETDDKLMVIVEIPSGCILQKFEIGQGDNEVTLSFEKHPMSFNPSAIQKILYKKNIVQDPPNQNGVSLASKQWKLP